MINRNGLFFLGFGTLFKFWRSYVLILAPLLLLPIALADHGSEEMRCAYVALIMAIYWVSEALPLPVTSLIPMVALPLLGIMSTVRLQRKLCLLGSFLSHALYFTVRGQCELPQSNELYVSWRPNSCSCD